MLLAHGRDSRIAPGGLYITPTSIYVATTARPIVSPFGFPLASSQRFARVHSGVEAQKEIAPIRLPTYYAALQNIVTSPTTMSFRAEFRHPLVGWRNAVEEPALGRSREAGFSTAQNCPRADSLAALEMTEEVYVSLYCAISVI